MKIPIHIKGSNVEIDRTEIAPGYTLVTTGVISWPCYATEGAGLFSRVGVKMSLIVTNGSFTQTYKLIEENYEI